MMNSEDFDSISAAKTGILDAAAECFMALGSDVASIDDIARRLGATKGKIYHHFPTKGALLNAVRMRAVRFTFHAVLPEAGAATPPGEKFRRMAFAHVSTVLETLPYHKVVLQHYRAMTAKSTTALEREQSAEIDAERRRYEDLFREVIGQGIEAGTFRERNLSISLHSVLVFLNSPVFWFQAPKGDSTANRHAIATQLSEMALSSLC